jgi:hypothetical protein
VVNDPLPVSEENIDVKMTIGLDVEMENKF